jgi:hypothetical protein
VASIAVKRNGALALTTRETSFFSFPRNFRRFFRENKDMQTISSALGSTSTAFPELTVKAFDRDMRSEEPLEDTKTHACGYYEIFYTAEQFRRAEKGTADLIVRAYDAQGEMGTIGNFNPKVEHDERSNAAVHNRRQIEHSPSRRSVAFNRQTK